MYALYLHIPFCRARCSYCDFNTYTTLGDLQGEYVAALAREIRLVGDTGRAGEAGRAGDERAAVDTIFFGGGTPSLLTPEQVATLLAAVRDSFALASDAEITMEANPGTVDEAWLAAVRALGVNRLSFGVQSALPHELALLGREHDFAAAVTALSAARAAGFDNLNLDLIYGLPGQSVADWQRTLDAALPLGVEHVSLYCLTIEPGTPMQRWLHNGTIMAPDPDTAADQYEAACHALAAAGYGHYEISNWARPGRECRHNIVYWRNRPYLGLGAGAHGMAGGYRYQVVRQPRTYIKRITNYELRITNGEPRATNDEPRAANDERRGGHRPPATDLLTTDLLNTDLLTTDLLNTDPLTIDLLNTDPLNTDLLITDPLTTDPLTTGHSPPATLPVSPSPLPPFPLSPAVAAHHRVDEAEAMSDTAITQLRLLDEGLDLGAFEARFGRAFDEVYRDEVRQLVDWGLLRVDGHRLLLTEKGRFLSNQVFYRFV
ncbi:MAG TPA: radical SAM family heme chaperone HemW [Promineifilum sp.]|nr:radical SAM family heme chaperone HemW [Promineifilum sp.]